MGDEIEGFELGRQYLLPVDLEGKTGQIQYGLILETEHDETEKMVQKVILHHLFTEP
ncbi:MULTISPECIES: hypothetical protein [unclassified Shewanella]|uniref:hypothetical protein n=1 Tax=unclassified Shewanella TaxID=196818 RepID=UPI0012FEA85C|nr:MULTISPECIES: hypothetical protein [unclassified Shewanella]